MSSEEKTGIRDMKSTSQILEQEVLPHLPSSSKSLEKGIKNLVEAARKEGAEQVKKIVASAFYEDEGGLTPMHPLQILELIDSND